MKELISVSKDAIIVAMNDQAYVAVATAEDDFSLIQLLCGTSLHTKSAPTVDSSHEEKRQFETNNIDCNQIQAVAITSSNANDRIYCAVSRYDKSLSIYSMSNNDTTNIKETSEAAPILVHKTNKRCSALEFANISSDNDSSNGRGVLDVIVAADLAGDVHAFPVELLDTITTKVGQKRFLLGHTASMLTSLKIVHDKIFTADRDEKVRVSSFPQTFEVLGYLLGNESYVTDIDVKQDKYCVTVSGDCTMRLWDYRTYQEILCIHLSRELNGESCQVSNNEQGVDEPQKNVRCLPVRVCFNPEGNLIAVIFNIMNCVDIYAIKESKGGEVSGVQVEKMQSIQCLKPLGMAFFRDDLIVLTVEPKYFMCFRRNGDDEFADQEHQCKLVDSVRCIGEKNGIDMPESILEMDGATGKIKLERNMKDEIEGFVEHKPWLEGKRVQRKREKEKRRKKRRLEELANQEDGNVER